MSMAIGYQLPSLTISTGLRRGPPEDRLGWQLVRFILSNSAHILSRLSFSNELNAGVCRRWLCASEGDQHRCDHYDVSPHLMMS